MIKKIKKVITKIIDYIEEKRVEKLHERIRKEDVFIYK
jgi:hypothetical protein